MIKKKESAKPKAAKILNNGVLDSLENEEDSYNHLNDPTGQNDIENDEYDYLNEGRNKFKQLKQLSEINKSNGQCVQQMCQR